MFSLITFIYWLAIGLAAGAVVSSFFEWTLHRYFMHRPFFSFTYPFRSHALVHHHVFKSDHTYHVVREADKKIIPMAWWNGPVLIFTGMVWAMGRKGRLDSSDGLVLVGLFFFWQCIHVFEVLRQNARQGKSAPGLMLPVNLALLAVGAYGIYVSTGWLVAWISNLHTGFIQAKYLGWLSGWLMVLPNAVLAFYYGWRKQPEIVYTSQVGDAHVSIPLCLGVYALYQPMTLPAFFHTGMLILLGATLVHFFFVALFGRLPRFVGFALVAAYGYFLWKGLLG